MLRITIFNKLIRRFNFCHLFCIGLSTQYLYYRYKTFLGKKGYLSNSMHVESYDISTFAQNFFGTFQYHAKTWPQHGLAVLSD